MDTNRTVNTIKLPTKAITKDCLQECLDILLHTILTQRIPDIEDACNETKSPKLNMKYVAEYSNCPVQSCRERFPGEDRPDANLAS